MFQLSWKETGSLRSQIVTLNKAKPEASRRGKHIKYLPYAFTEHGVAILSSVLNSERAIQVIEPPKLKERMMESFCPPQGRDLADNL